ncbi:DNA polymerase Y family protein [Comamonas sp. 26]|uniref:Y-family DNA polymerase n=1 Tax=Comamonas sp. 26 TaxID=2035201 RepID=UPI000C193E5C|nr:DNA polymerase Y family protein [Comamonas sp. 26]PIG09174.1 protein ImuB [Comamonas sp. 26]
MDCRAHWIAWPAACLSESSPIPDSVCWWALEFSPRVVLLEDALLMETSMVQRLWGGIEAMLERLDQSFAQVCVPAPGQASVQQSLRAQGLTAWQALARLRLQQKCLEQGQRRVSLEGIDALPLWTLTALQQHSALLSRLGCQTWGDVRALPRAGLSRRLGARTLRVLDEAYGVLPQPLDWLQLPQQFIQRHDLGYPAHSADAVLQAAQPLLRALQTWLQARHHAVLALQLRWHHDLRRIDGQELPPWDGLCIRTAQPTQGMDHLQRLLREQLAQRRWRAPVDMLELQALETMPWSAEPQSCLPVSQGQGMPDSLAWHEWVERLSARWGDDAVQMVQPLADHRPEAMQRCQSAMNLLQNPKPVGTKNSQTGCADPWQALWPPWLLPQPQALDVEGNRPQWLGPLQLKAGPYRLEAGWWDGENKGQEGAQSGSQTGLAVRDYFVAYNAVVGHVWIYRERVRADTPMRMAIGSVNWFAQGIYG